MNVHKAGSRHLNLSVVGTCSRIKEVVGLQKLKVTLCNRSQTALFSQFFVCNARGCHPGLPR